jgi:hypothetical protein
MNDYRRALSEFPKLKDKEPDPRFEQWLREADAFVTSDS